VLLSLLFKSCFEEMLAKGKTGPAIYCIEAAYQREAPICG
jgi:hypothetical protein